MREVLEETGLVVQNAYQAVVTNCVRVDHNYHYLVSFVVAEVADTTCEPSNLEPDKCAGWQWVPWVGSPIWESEPIFYALEDVRATSFTPFNSPPAAAEQTKLALPWPESLPQGPDELEQQLIVGKADHGNLPPPPPPPSYLTYESPQAARNELSTAGKVGYLLAAAAAGASVAIAAMMR